MSYDPKDFQGRSEKQYQFSAIMVLVSLIAICVTLIWMSLY
jgi:hypothetical protein